MNYIAGLNGLRALAVIAVVWHHSPHASSGPLQDNGFLGVDVFFVLSGFLITSLLIHEQQRSGSVSLTQFYARRTLRIFPLYYAVLAAMSLYFWFRADPEFFRDLPYHLSYTSNWVEISGLMRISWSLSTEEQFYLLWPVLFVLLPRNRSVALLLAFLVLNQAVNFGLLDRWIPYASLPILQCTFTPIILGSLLAFLMQAYGAEIAKVPAWVLVAGALCVMLIAASATDMRGLPRLAFHAATAILLAALASDPRTWLARALEFPPLAYVGKVSYGIYLLHTVGLHLGRNFPDRWVFAVGFAATLLLATLSYWLFERPLLRLKDRFRPAGDERTLSAAG